MVACLTALPRLRTLFIGFRSAASRPRRMRPPPVTRTVLPALTEFRFKGASKYLEDFVAHIDTPQLEDIISIDYLYEPDPRDFEVAQLSKFVGRTMGPFRRAYVSLLKNRVVVNLDRHANYTGCDRRPVGTTISFTLIDWHIYQLDQPSRVLSKFSAALSTVVHLELKVKIQLGVGTNNIAWLRLLRLFPAMQMLHVSRARSGLVALALEDITAEMIAEVLPPSLDLICLAGQPAPSLEKFAAACRLTGRPVTVIDWEWEFEKRVKSYYSE